LLYSNISVKIVILSVEIWSIMLHMYYFKKKKKGGDGMLGEEGMGFFVI